MILRLVACIALAPTLVLGHQCQTSHDCYARMTTANQLALCTDLKDVVCSTACSETLSEEYYAGALCNYMNLGTNCRACVFEESVYFEEFPHLACAHASLPAFCNNTLTLTFPPTAAPSPAASSSAPTPS